MIEYLKTDKRKGMKEMVINEFIENPYFWYEDNRAIEIILENIKFMCLDAVVHV